MGFIFICSTLKFWVMPFFAHRSGTPPRLQLGYCLLIGFHSIAVNTQALLTALWCMTKCRIITVTHVASQIAVRTPWERKLALRALWSSAIRVFSPHSSLGFSICWGQTGPSWRLVSYKRNLGQQVVLHQHHWSLTDSFLDVKSLSIQITVLSSNFPFLNLALRLLLLIANLTPGISLQLCPHRAHKCRKFTFTSPPFSPLCCKMLKSTLLWKFPESNFVKIFHV